MLSDQIHNQTDKILDLERTLDSKKEALKKTEDLLQIEMINRFDILDNKSDPMKIEIYAQVGPGNDQAGTPLQSVRVEIETGIERQKLSFSFKAMFELFGKQNYKTIRLLRLCMNCMSDNNGEGKRGVATAIGKNP